VSRYIDIFVASDETPEQFAASLESLLKRHIERVTDRGEEVLYLYSGDYKWFDICRGMLDRHPDYGYQLYVGRGHHDIGDRLRANFAWWIMERLSTRYAVILEDNQSRISICLETGESAPKGVLRNIAHAGGGDIATIFASSSETPEQFVGSLARLLDMEAHLGSRPRSPVIAVMVGEAVRMRVETHDYEDVLDLHLSRYRYCIDLDPLDAGGVFARLKASERYRLLWLENLEHPVDVYDPASERAASERAASEPTAPERVKDSP
jgi:hypothetical protein